MSQFFFSFLAIFVFIFSTTVSLAFLYYSLLKTNKYLSVKDDYKRDKIVNGSGIIIVLETIIFLIYIINFSSYSSFAHQAIPRPNTFAFSIFFLLLLSFFDDCKSIDFRIRLFAQISIVFLSLSLITFNSQIELPIKIQQYFVIFLWVYILNITNFIDGLDGFLLIHAISVFSILIIKFILDQQLLFSTIISFFLLPGSLALLTMNFPKAKIFLGDSGSIFFGFVFGFIFFELVFNSYFLIALTTILYPFLDVTITLIKKIINKRKLWSRDFDYFFLMPVVKGKLSHTASTKPFIIFNFFLILNTAFMIFLNNHFLFLTNVLIAFILIKYYTKKN